MKPKVDLLICFYGIPSVWLKAAQSMHISEPSSLFPTTDSPNDPSSLLPSSQHQFPSMIATHDNPSTNSISGLGGPSFIPTPAFQPSALDQSPSRPPMSPDTPNGDLDSPTCQTPEVDPQILEALRSKDRLYVLKLGEAMESLISERR